MCDSNNKKGKFFTEAEILYTIEAKLVLTQNILLSL